MILCHPYDPANMFGFQALFPLIDDAGAKTKLRKSHHTNMVFRAGRPILIHHGAITLLTEMSGSEVQTALRLLMALVDTPRPVAATREIRILFWNGHPISVHPARNLLVGLGFVEERESDGLVYAGSHPPDVGTVVWTEMGTPDRFHRHGSDPDPVAYDADQMVDLAPIEVRDPLRAILALLGRSLPDVFELVFAKSGSR